MATNDDAQFCIIRYKSSGYMFAGSGSFAVPKLYLWKNAKALITRHKKKFPETELEIVPIEISYGTPITI